jgi:hypothetical protein
MNEANLGLFWDSRVMEPELSSSEKALRDQFVKEYLYDFDAYQACIRVGFANQFASDYARRLMGEPYVQRRIAELSKITPEDEHEQLEQDRLLTLRVLREAAQRGPYASRVAAAAKLSAILGMDAPVKTSAEVMHRGGVMQVPSIANLDDWEQAATATQTKLVKESRSNG